VQLHSARAVEHHENQEQSTAGGAERNSIRGKGCGEQAWDVSNACLSAFAWDFFLLQAFTANCGFLSSGKPRARLVFLSQIFCGAVSRA